MIYYIADMHFGHENVIRFDDRPFADTEQMDEVLIQNWNERVTADDTVYVLGDAFRGRQIFANYPTCAIDHVHHARRQ